MKLNILHLIAAFPIRAQRINLIEPIILKYLANQQVMKLTKMKIMIFYHLLNNIFSNLLISRNNKINR
jgi:hypothetical protein